MLLEICANSYQSAINAQEAGAHRIELCSELSIGGVTPSYGLLKLVLSTLRLPVFVLIRPRSGDFIYTKSEFDTMKTDIKLCKSLGARGIVSGVLTKERTIDLLRTQELIECAGSMEFTFHRAFDIVKDPFDALEQLIEMGAHRILTSGQRERAEEGLELLEALVDRAKGRIGIMAGSGVSAENVSKFRAIGITEVHSSASAPIEQAEGFFFTPQTVSDLPTIKSLIHAL